MTKKIKDKCKQAEGEMVKVISLDDYNKYQEIAKSLINANKIIGIKDEEIKSIQSYCNGQLNEKDSIIYDLTEYKKYAELDIINLHNEAKNQALLINSLKKNYDDLKESHNNNKLTDENEYWKEQTDFAVNKSDKLKNRITELEITNEKMNKSLSEVNLLLQISGNIIKEGYK